MRTAISRRGRTAASGALQARCFHFGSPAYNAAFLPAVEVDPGPIRSAAVLAVAAQRSRPRQWFNEPVTSLLRGTTLTGGTRVETIDAFGRANGAQLLASEAEMQTIIEHAELFVGTPRDLRSAVRRAEASMLGEHAGALVANQTLDFGKQDGVTEIEEAHQANAVEQRLNDLVWQSEQAGQLQIPRRVVLVPCVSNFSHFLDMCRKVCRNLELGVPVIVLSRSHTAQYPFRWAQLLQAELQAQGLDPSLFTFCSADLAAQQRLLRAATAAAAADPASADAPPTPFLFTGSRGLAAAIKAEDAPGMIASTQGPNLMVAFGLPPPVAAAAALSSTIEHSGQCTALRVLLAPGATEEAVQGMFGSTVHGQDAPEYLRAGTFAGLLEPPPTTGTGGDTPPGYTSHPLLPKVSYRLVRGLPDPPIPAGAPAEGEPLREHWRQVVLDVASPPAGGDLGSDANADAVAAWLVKHQPITLSINGATGDADYTAALHARVHATADDALPVAEHLRFARRVFERSALCVYSIGDAGAPALSAQARPQDGECFGELPPLGIMGQVTTFPMLVPSAQPAYYAHYSRPYLEALAADPAPMPELISRLAGAPPACDATMDAAEAAAPIVSAFCAAADAAATKGYLQLLGGYLVGAAGGVPRRGMGRRTCLYGLQRPPMDGRLTALRCGPHTSIDQVLPHALAFAATNARAQCMLSVDPSNDELLERFTKLVLHVPGLDDMPLLIHTEQQFKVVQPNLLRSLRPDDEALTRHPFPMAQQFVSRIVTLGHVKSTRANDEVFAEYFCRSRKWLRIGRWD